MKPLIIAEIGQAHDGSLGMAHSYIDALKDTGVDIIKFQTHIAEAESSAIEPFRVKFSYEDNNRFDYWKRMEFSMDQWIELKSHCDDVGLEFMSSPFSIQAVDLLEKLKVNRYKIGSGEISNFLMLQRIKETKKEIILSTGLASYKEIDDTLDFLGEEYLKKVSILQCTTKYPTTAKDIGINLLEELKTRYKTKVGLSDHSGVIYPCLAATFLGAEILEFHVAFDKKQFGPDSSSSIEIREIEKLMDGINFMSEMSTSPLEKAKSPNPELSKLFGKSLSFNKNLKKGTIITKGDLESKKPYGQGIPAAEYLNVIGKKTSRDVMKWEFVQLKDLEK